MPVLFLSRAGPLLDLIELGGVRVDAVFWDNTVVVIDRLSETPAFIGLAFQFGLCEEVENGGEKFDELFKSFGLDEHVVYIDTHDEAD